MKKTTEKPKSSKTKNVVLAEIPADENKSAPKAPKKKIEPKTKIQRIVLTGFMGAGKTSIGQILAEKLNATFIDLDEYLEVSENRTIPQLMQTLGEATFREIESEKLREVFSLPNASVVALGGGTWIIEENRQFLQQKDTCVIWLDAPFELCWKRIKAEDKDRPLAQKKKDAKILFESRRDFYALADETIEINARKQNETYAAEILAKLSA